MIRLLEVQSPEDLPVIRCLFREYADALGEQGIDLCFQGFEAELAGLPGKYAAPGGTMLIAWDDNIPVGCVALRPIDGSADAGEMKRLYVRPGQRGAALGRRLAEALCEKARRAGYRRICLDTLPSMTSAIALYATMGFMPIDPYIYNPIDGVRYLGLDL